VGVAYIAALESLCSGKMAIKSKALARPTLAPEKFHLNTHALFQYSIFRSSHPCCSVSECDICWLQKLRDRRYMTGALPGALEAFLGLRGIRTLPVRMQRHEQNAGVIAKRLEDHAAVEKVLYPGQFQRFWD